VCIMRLQVNWQALWKPRWQRSMREVLVLPLIILTMLVPLGVFTGELPCYCYASDDLLASLHFTMQAFDDLARFSPCFYTC